jgi:uncharacterized protein (DUF433 family)
MVSVVLDNLAAGVEIPEIIAGYPPLTDPDIRAAIAYGADLARDQVVALPSGVL